MFVIFSNVCAVEVDYFSMFYTETYKPPNLNHSKWFKFTSNIDIFNIVFDIKEVLWPFLKWSFLSRLYIMRG